MKRLVYLPLLVFTTISSGQSFPARNVNDDYFVTSFFNSTISKNVPYEFVRDKKGIYWFFYKSESYNKVFSFDGVNWKSYDLRSPNGSSKPFILNYIIETDDGNIWLSTE